MSYEVPIIATPDISHLNTQLPIAPHHPQPMAPPSQYQSYQLRPPPPGAQPPRQTYAGVNFVPMQRHASTRSDSPHMLGGHVFGRPPQPEMIEANTHLSFDYGLDSSFTEMPQGISPARALGPAPQVQFATPTAKTQMTPTAQTFKNSYVSSSAGSSSDTNSSVERPMIRASLADSDEENDSPTKRLGSRLPDARGPPKRVPVKAPPRTATLPKAPTAPQPATSGRSSAKFAKVAEDPGVEGIPPGPRSTERPQQSFACIIGQAILKSSAGGLSLEHIYRYVETAYPYFKTVDQWRNSVRHNLSIHKIFSTIPRTDKHPPGKGGIWVIDECEKIHWPSEDKFIKNFPPSHPHHAVCRQTQHERTAELKAKEKAEAEGREWVPRKTKKVRKLREEDPKKLELKPPPPVPRLVAPPQHMATIPPPRPTIRGPMSPPPRPSANLAAAFEFEDDGDFVPFDRIPQPSFPLKKLGPSAMCPTVGADQDDVENVFGSAPKRVRMAQAEPLSPILEQHVASAYLNDDDDDMFITPARERSKAQPASTSYQFSSSTLKTTPALTQTSSSPTSSPMPSTVTRPSGLQQAWSHMDIPTPKLESAFVLRPSIKRNLDDDEPPMHFMPKIDRQPPKTPVTRSSAAAERTPRVGGLRTPLVKTPLTYGSPARAPPSASAHLSTPLWEMSGVLDRMAESPTRTPRNDVPPTSPTHYSLSECGNSPVMKRRKITTAA